jgi:replicative DNA helicase
MTAVIDPIDLSATGFSQDEAEADLLGTIIYDAENGAYASREALAEAATYLVAADFRQRAFSLLFETMLDLAEAGVAPDLTVLTAEMRTREPDYSPADPHRGIYALVTRASNYEVTIPRIRSLARKIHEAAERRRLLRLGERVTALSADRSISPSDAVVQLEEVMRQEFRPPRRGADTTIAASAASFRSQVAEWRATPGALRGVSSGLRCVDRITRGVRRGALWVIGGRTSMGKTAFSLTMLRHAAFNCAKGHLVGMVSLEMSVDQLMLRLAAMLSRQSASAIEDGDPAVDWDAVDDAITLLSELPMRIVDARGANRRVNGGRGRMTPEEIRRHVLAWRQEGVLDLVVVDYLEMVHPPRGTEKAQRDEKLAAISTALKELAMEAEVGVVLLTQLNREAEHASSRIPGLDTVRGGDGPPNDADVVIFPVRYDYWRARGKDIPPEVASRPAGYCDINVAKHRQGKVGLVPAYYVGEQMEFVDFDAERNVALDFQGNVIATWR